MHTALRKGPLFYKKAIFHFFYKKIPPSPFSFPAYLGLSDLGQRSYVAGHRIRTRRRPSNNVLGAVSFLSTFTATD